MLDKTDGGKKGNDTVGMLPQRAAVFRTSDDVLQVQRKVALPWFDYIRLRVCTAQSILELLNVMLTLGYATNGCHQGSAASCSQVIQPEGPICWVAMTPLMYSRFQLEWAWNNEQRSFTLLYSSKAEGEFNISWRHKPRRCLFTFALAGPSILNFRAPNSLKVSSTCTYDNICLFMLRVRK